MGKQQPNVNFSKVNICNAISIRFSMGIFFFFFELDNVIFKLHGRLSADKRQENMKKQ